MHPYFPNNRCVIFRAIHPAIISSIHPAMVYPVDYGGNALYFDPAHLAGLAAVPFMRRHPTGAAKIYRRQCGNTIPVEAKARRLRARGGLSASAIMTQ